MTEILKIENLTKIYPNGVKANDNLNISVREGEIVGIIGPNGAGKTTLIRQVLGLLRPTNGEIKVFEEEISKSPHIVRENINYCPQNILYFPSLTVKETIEFALKFKGLKNELLSQKVEEVLKGSELENFKNHAGYMLSSGMMRLLLLNIAIARDTPLLILDEPTAMVDVISKTRIWERLSQLRSMKNKAVLIASHDMNEVKSLCDKVYIIVRGKIIAEGSPEEISTLMKMPVEITFIPFDEEKVEKVFEYEKSLGFKKEYNVFNVIFDELNKGINFIKEVNELAGFKYLELEAPSFEKTVVKLLEEGEKK
ncbi:ABC transporter related protein [Thermoanaerobacter mathranii subsp. mathranii str. A3]|uniref:ABC transporter related protein n=1 Tax=Thermoanaerobacter mathranii subsp. mathranii (strain DSM 11426 / CCUG 53645 / CIP 108742 / A3) TaxID=583358 RepID=A0ABM5LSE9_THEM3|nr:ABC transporter ATP-binding protein [Thermoanaerobacter mathranii]ADH61661.1 ABC transporter related protein [Thermoanaerobacter mathranii subsp. mathranii str. A3]